MEAVLVKMEGEVKDALLEGQSDNRLLLMYIDFAGMNASEQRHLTNDPLNEPRLWRKFFTRWVREGILEGEKIDRIERKLLEEAKQVG